MHERIPERTAIRLKIMLYDEGFAGRVIRKMREAYYKTKRTTTDGAEITTAQCPDNPTTRTP